MNRKYDTARYRQSVELLRQYFDRPALTTDLIVGFPGEDEGEFEATLAFLRECRFSAMHIFPYSRRPGTPAAALPNQCLNGVKEERAHRAAQVAAELEGEYLTSWVGTALPVHFEEEREGCWRGLTPQYMEVRAQGRDLHNVQKTVEITGRQGGALLGRVVE